VRIGAATIITPAGIQGPGTVVVDDGTIVAIEPAAPSTPVEARLLVPGFIDLQVNGIGPIDVAHAADSDWDDLDERLLAQGVTTWCPTLVTAPLDRFEAPLDRIAAAASRDEGRVRPMIAGAHLEGPFLGGAPGAHPRDLIRAPDLDWLGALPDVVRVTLELDREVSYHEERIGGPARLFFDLKNGVVSGSSWPVSTLNLTIRLSVSRITV